VQYKNDFAVVLASKFNDKTLRLIAPHRGNGKVEVNASNVKATGFHIPTVVHNGKSVLVTRRGLLISLTSERLLRSDTKDGTAILKLARAS
jgi:hypothetical protein